MTGGSAHEGEGGRTAGFRAAVQKQAPDLLDYFAWRLPSSEDAADALAETLLQAWRRADQLPEDPTQARMWLYTIAANVLSNQNRSGRRRAALTDRLREHLSSVLAEPRADLAEQVAVRDAVARLPGEQGELVRLVHWDGLTLAQAAGVLGINPSTARSRYAAARHALRLALESGCPRVTTPAGHSRQL